MAWVGWGMQRSEGRLQRWKSTPYPLQSDLLIGPLPPGGTTTTMNVSPNAGLRQVISADQIQKRVRELGRQISDDYRGETMIALGILENSFLFMADLVRAVDIPLICSFIKPS